MTIERCVLVLLGSLGVASASAQRVEAQTWPELSGIYRGHGLAIQPCGNGEWMRRNFETDEFCRGSNEGFPFTEQGWENWENFNPSDDPVLGCIEYFPRSPIRGRVMRLAVGEETTEIAYAFNGQWHTRTVHMNGPAPPPDTPHTRMGYSVGHWVGDSLIVETTHTVGGPMFNDHKPSSPEAKFTERFWKAPDGRNLLLDITIDDPINYEKPFLLNRQERRWAPDYELGDGSECVPTTLWERRQRELERENPE